MNSYILLRDNKETGPHSIIDLQRIGLKPNDLIWVECQSVGWRNPGEISELKKMLDGVPEQTVPAQQAVTVQEILPVTKEVITQEELIQLDTPVKKSVFVALPVNKTTTLKPEQKQVFIQPEQNHSIIHQDLKSADRYKPIPSDLYGETDEKTEPDNYPEKAETKYTRSLDEIKEMYVKNIEQRKTKPRRFPIRLPRQVMKAAIYVGLVLVGAVTVLLFKNSGNKMPSIADQQSPLTAKIKERPDSILAENSENSIITDPSDVQENFSPGETGTNPSPKSQPAPVENKINSRENSMLIAERDNDREERSTGDDPISIPKNETPEVRKIPLESIASQLSVKTNSYTIAALGGIRNLEMTLQNDSKYHLDKVTVELRYLNPGGIILKTEDIHFKSIDPNATQTIPVKKSNRGVKVSYKITRIESKEIGGSTAGL